MDGLGIAVRYSNEFRSASLKIKKKNQSHVNIV